MSTSVVYTADDVRAADLELMLSQLREELDRMSGRNLLIAGGAGFLGYYLVQTALHWNDTNPAREPIRVSILENFVRGVPTWLTRLEARQDLTLIRHDVTQPFPADLGRHEYLVHAASIASPTYYRQYPIETMDANVNGLRHFLEYCLAQQRAGHPVESFLFYSSSEIYGDPTPENIPTPETYRGNVSCTGPRACYDESKRYGETLCVNFAQQHGLPVKVARPFNNYGPGLKISDRRVIPDFARDILNERDIVLLSDGSPTRTFCYVADAITGYYKILVNGRPGEAYNIGIERPEISVLELAEHMIAIGRELFGYEGTLVSQASTDAAYLVDNPYRRCPITTKAETELGFAPQIGIDEGLRRSLVWYSDNRDAEDA